MVLHLPSGRWRTARLATVGTALQVLKGMPIDVVPFAARGVGRRGVRAEAALHCAGFAVRLERGHLEMFPVYQFGGQHAWGAVNAIQLQFNKKRDSYCEIFHFSA